MPGRTNHNTIEADKPGTFLGACAEYCGLSHADMRFRVIAQPMDEWKAWLAGQQEGPAQPWTGEIKKLTATKYAVHELPRLQRLDEDELRRRTSPTSPAARTFAGGTYEVNRKNLTNWVLNAPAMIADAVEGLPTAATGHRASACPRSRRTPQGPTRDDARRTRTRS